jgi:hypothetical protein
MSNTFLFRWELKPGCEIAFGIRRGSSVGLGFFTSASHHKHKLSRLALTLPWCF